MKTTRPGVAGSSARGFKPGRQREDRTSSPPAPEMEIISSRNGVLEALRAGKRVRRLLLLDELSKEDSTLEAIRLAGGLGIAQELVTRRQLDAVAPDHQGMVVVASPYDYANWSDLLGKLRASESAPSVLLLDTLHDPQNLGSLLRTGEAVGLDAVVLPKRRSVSVTPAVVRSSAGAVEHMAVARVPNLVRSVEDLKEAGFWVAGIDMDGDRMYWELDMSGPTALVLGGEDHGLGRLLKEQCDFLIKLPMEGRVSSLNAAIAGSVVLYEMARQRKLNKTVIDNT